MAIRHTLLLVLLVACKQSKESTCDELARMGIAVADELGKQLGDKGGKSLGADPEIKQKMKEFKEQCMRWPDEVFECMRKNDETSPKCVAAMEHVTGKVSANAERAPDGPAIVASATLGEADWDGVPVMLAKDGTLTAAPHKAIAAFDATGKEKWRVDLEHAGWLLALGDGAILVGARANSELVALDAADGAVKWRVEIPIAEDGDEYDDRSARGAVRAGGRVLVATEDGRFLKLAPETCATKKQRGCLELAFALPDETFDTPHLLAMGERIVVGEENAIRVFSPSGKQLAAIHVRDSFGGFAFATPGRLAATMDDELVVFDLEQCGATTIALPRKRGRMYMRGDGECDDCVSPRNGCVVARSELEDVESVAPTVLRDGSLVVTNLDGPARAAIDGTKRWVSEIDAVGPIREVGDLVAFVSRGDDDAPARLVALDAATGKAKWQRVLPGLKSSEISYTSESIVEVNGAWLVAGAKGRVSWIKLTSQ